MSPTPPQRQTELDWQRAFPSPKPVTRSVSRQTILNSVPTASRGASSSSPGSEHLSTEHNRPGASIPPNPVSRRWSGHRTSSCQLSGTAASTRALPARIPSPKTRPREHCRLPLHYSESKLRKDPSKSSSSPHTIPIGPLRSGSFNRLYPGARPHRANSDFSCLCAPDTIFTLMSLNRARQLVVSFAG